MNVTLLFFLALIIFLQIILFVSLYGRGNNVSNHVPTVDKLFHDYSKMLKQNDTVTLTANNQRIINDWAFGAHNDLPAFADYRDGTQVFGNFMGFVDIIARYHIVHDAKEFVPILTDIVDRLWALVPDPTQDFFNDPPVGNLGYTWIALVSRDMLLIRMSPFMPQQVKDRARALIRAVLKSTVRNCGLNATGPNAIYQLPHKLYSDYDTVEEMVRAFRSDDYKVLRDAFEIALSSTQVIEDGWKEDKTFIFHSTVAYYGYIMTIYNTPFDWLSSYFSTMLKSRHDLNELLRVLFSNHIRNAPYGFNSRGITSNTKPILEAGVKSVPGNHLLPFSGWYLYKRDDAEYYGRVQRPGIASYEGDRNSQNLGGLWMLGKHAYVRGSHITYNAKTLPHHPGVIQKLPDQLDSFPHPGTRFNTFRTTSTVHSSYIGILNDHPLKSIFFMQHFHNDNMAIEYMEFGTVDDRGVHVYFTCNSTDDDNNVRYFNVKQPDFPTFIDGVAEDAQLELQLPMAQPLSYFISFEGGPTADTVSFDGAARVTATIAGVLYHFDYQTDDPNMTCLVYNNQSGAHMLTNNIVSNENVQFNRTTYRRLKNKMYIPTG